MSIDYSKKTSRIVTATKKLVDDLLEINTENRHIKKSHLKWLMEAINKGDFILTSQAIGISAKGTLLDGQHRLMALKEMGYPAVELLIVTGLDEKAKIYIDQGAKRSIPDMLKIVLNTSVSNKMASMVNMKLKLQETKEGFSFRSKGVSKPQLEDIVEFTDKNFDRIVEIISAAGQLARAGILAALLDFSIKYDHDSALEFAEKVKNGEHLTKEMPAYRLREYIMAGHKRTTYGSSGQLEDYKNTVTACLAFAHSERLSSLRPSNSWDNIKKLPRNYPKGQIVKAADAARSHAA